ncbi:MAG: protein kinase [Sphingobacteriales bacterium]|nr:protein kinase [Sphingobacteriales bacterium]
MIKKIGDGGFGDVFEATDLQSGDNYALKYCRETDMGPIGRFKREVQILASLKHPNVIGLIDVNLNYAPPFFIMPLAAKNVEKLTSSMRGQTLDLLRIFKEICLGVKAIHDAGYFHRDINPRNALFFDDGRIVVSDLGFGRNIDRKSEVHDSSKYGNGTVVYMAPEQKDALENADHRTDVYQLGKTLQTLFSGDPTAMDTTNIPPGVIHIIRTATAFNPGSRHQSVSELMNDIDVYSSKFDPITNSQLGFETANNLIKQSIRENDLTIEKCLSLIDIMVSGKMSEIEYVENFDKIPTQALKHMAQRLDSELDRMLSLYDEYIPEYRRNAEWDYAEVISEKMRTIYESTNNLDFKARTLRIILQNAISFNRFSVMDDFDSILQSIKSDDEGFAIAQMLRQEQDNYSRLFDRVPPSKLHFHIRNVQKEIKEEVDAARNSVKKGHEIPPEY